MALAVAAGAIFISCDCFYIDPRVGRMAQLPVRYWLERANHPMFQAPFGNEG